MSTRTCVVITIVSSTLLTLLQPLWYALLAMNFQWGVAVHDIKIGRFLKGRMPKAEFRERMRPFLRKAGRQLFKDYVLFPALAFWQWPRVLLGNLALGLMPAVTYTEQSVDLTDGDLLVIYSDGLTDALDDAGDCARKRPGWARTSSLSRIGSRSRSSAHVMPRGSTPSRANQSR